MNKKLIFAITSVLFTSGIQAAVLDDETYKEQLKYLEKEGVPLPDEGVVLVSKEELHMPDYILKKHETDYREIAKFGYVKEDSSRAEELLNYKSIAAERFKKFSGFQKPGSTSLRKAISELPIAYTYVGIPESGVTTMIGIAPLGSYKKPDGWSGAIEYFEVSKLGTCAFSEKNLRITHGSSHIDRDIVKYTVNGKITLSDVRGSDTTGYLYQLTWFDPVFERTLECANPSYSPDIEKQIIKLAKNIDLK